MTQHEVIALLKKNAMVVASLGGQYNIYPSDQAIIHSNKEPNVFTTQFENNEIILVGYTPLGHRSAHEISHAILNALAEAANGHGNADIFFEEGVHKFSLTWKFV